MDVQKYIKRLKFARADWSRNIGEFESREDALNFLNAREFFFGDPFVVKYTENGEAKLMLAIGKSENPEITADTTEVTGGVGEGAYELFDMNEFHDAIAELSGQTTANTEDIAELFELIDSITGDTSDLKEIVGTGFTGHGRTITITDRIREDEELAGISWKHGNGELETGRAHLDPEEVPYASGSTLMEMLLTVSDTLNTAVTFDVMYDTQHNVLKVVYGDGHVKDVPLTNVSIVEYIKYDAATEEIVIGYKSGEHGDVTEVRIPVRDIINEWVTVDTNTVAMEKTVVVDGKDQLSANVKISDDADNMLTAKDDGLYVSSAQIDDVKDILDNVKSGLGLEEDGKFPTDYFSGVTINGSSNIHEALLKLDNAAVSSNENIEQLRTDLENTANTLNQKIDDEIAAREELSNTVNGLESGLTELEQVVDEQQEVTAMAINRIAENVSENGNKIESLENSVSGLDERVNGIETGLNNEIAARESIEIKKFTEEECRELGDDVRAAYALVNNGVESEPIIVYKDEDQDIWIDEIYFGHVDDVLDGAGEDGWSQTNRVIQGTSGSTVVRFILTRKSDGWYKIGDKSGNINLDSITERIDALESEFDEAQEVTAIALNRLAESMYNVMSAIDELESRVTRHGGKIRDNEHAIEDLQNAVNELSTTSGDLENRVDAIESGITESEEVTAQAINRLAEGVVAAKTEVQLEDGTRHITLNKTYGDDGHEIYVIGEYHITSKKDFDDLKRDVDDLESRADNTDVFLGNIKDILNTEDDGHLTTRFTGAHTATASTYYDAINALDNAVTGAEQATRSLGNSYELEYTKDGENAEIALKWAVDGVDHVSRINVSDFVKDSFLENVNIQTGEDGKQYLVFTFKTYDGQPYPIWVPLASLAAIYKDGDGIDREALENDQVIKIKLDEVASKNWLAVSANGLRVTGVTEAIEEAVAGEAAAREAADNELRELINNEISARTEADNELNERITELSASTDSKFEEITEIIHEVTGETLNEYVRKDEVEDHLDSGSTLPVQNKVVTKALDDLMEDVQEIIESMTAITANTIEVNEITGGTAHFSGLTANTIYADEYQNLPTATTEQFGVVILDDHLDSASTNPVENKAITKVILENEETIAAALNDLETKKANKTDVQAADQNLQEQIDAITSGGLTGVRTEGGGNVLVSARKEGNDVVVSAGTIDTSHLLETSAFTAYTASTSNEFHTEHITADTIYTTAITATTANIDNLTAQTILTQSITGDTFYGDEAHFTGVTANTIYAEEYNNLPTATTTQFGVVKLDDALNSGSTNPVMNSAVTMVILENEEVVAAALNDLKHTKADTTAVTAADEYLQEQIDNINTEIEDITAGGLTGVVTAGTGNVVTKIEKDGNNVKATLGATVLESSVFNAYTANTKNEFVTSAITANTEYVEHLTANTINTTAITANTEVVSAITANTEYVEHLTANTINATAVTATTVSATTYNNLPTASTTNYGMVILDDHLDSGSTNAVMNSAITMVILEDEETVAAALNDLETRKANKTDVNDALDNHETRITNLEDAIETIEGGGLTGVTTTGTGNVITGLTKNGNSVVGQLGTITADDRLPITAFTAYTGSTQTTISNKADKTYVDSNFFHSAEYYSSGSTHEIRFKDASGNTISTVNADDFIKDGMVDNVQISGSSLVITFNTDSGKSPISIPLSNIFDPDNYYNKTQVDNLLAGKSNTGHTHTASELPSATTTEYGIVKLDDTLSTGSTNPVMNSAITQTILDNELVVAAALNDLNNRKANIEDIPVTISDLSDGGDVAMKTDLSGFLPLSGGTMTGNISGDTGVAIYMPGGFFQTSDERLKIFMGDVDNALEKAKQIPTKYFYWKDRYDGPREIGTSAQRVQELFPEIVSGDDKLSVDYSKLAIVALAAVKELSAKVDELQREIDELKK